MANVIGILGNASFILQYFLWFPFMMCLPKAIHTFQQESYQFKDYIRWISKNPKQALGGALKEIFIMLVYVISMMILDIAITKLNVPLNIRDAIHIIQLIAYQVLYFVLLILRALKWKKERSTAKKKLVYTARVKRLMFFSFLALILIHSALTVNGSAVESSVFEIQIAFAWTIICYMLLTFTMPAIVILGNILAYPTESIINEYYTSSANFKLSFNPKYKKLIRIGITGSYGKTSTKFILKTILSEKYNVLATPESYNTTMGNIKIIRKELKPEHEIFISEMGARYKRDIRKICDIVRPKLGLITSIGPQHLETFGSIENVAKTKAELIDSIPQDGAIFLPNDNSFCKKIYESKNIKNKFLYSASNKKSNVYAKDIKMSSKGCEFVAVTSIGDIKCCSKLLGEHNIQNILGAISVAIYLGLSKEQIANGVSKIEAIEHRLQIIENANGTIVIDDAFNSNPVGSKMALDVLKSFEGRKIIITPGMVELGADEAKFNKEFGEYMASCTDIAILVGIKRSKPIEEGLKAKGFDEMNIFVVPSLNDATKKLGEIVRSGDVILFENDLPDNYNE